MAESRGPLVCGVDAGTSAIKAVVFDTAGRMVAQACRPTPTERLGPGSAEHDADELWATTLDVLRDVLAELADPRRVRGIAVASMGEAGVLLDRAARPTAPVAAWYDTRPAAALVRLLERAGLERVREVTGLCPDPTFTLAKLAWLKETEPEALGRAEAWLGVGGWLAYRLCGERAIDLSHASRTMALDIAARRWDEALIDAAGIDAELLGDIAPAGSRLGTVLADVAAATGLSTDCVVGVGAHDHIAGLLAVGADASGVLMNSLGTAEALTLVHDRPVTDGSLAARGFHQGVIEVDRPLAYVFGGLPTSAAAVEWFRSALGGDADHATLVAEAEAVGSRAHEVMFLPQLRLGSPPFTDPIGRGAFLGISDACDRGVLFHAVLEGLALDSAHQALVLRELGLQSPERVVAIGGGTRNPLLMRLKAGLFGLPVEVPEVVEATALGAAMLAGLAAGLWPSLATARAEMALGRLIVRPAPAWDAGRRTKRVAAYACAYAAMRPLHAMLRGG